MAFNLFGSIGKEDTGEKPKNTLFVLPPKNRIEEIKEKAASDAAILELDKESDKPPQTESVKKAEGDAKEKAAQKAEKKPKSESDTAKESKEAQAAESEDAVTQAAFSPGEIKLDKVRADFSVQFKDEECLILTTLAESDDEIDEVRARDALERAKRRLRNAEARLDAKRAEAAIARAEARLKAKLSR